MKLKWTARHENTDSPYTADHRFRWACDEFSLEITKEGDGKYWLRHNKKPLGFGPRLKDAKEAAERYADKRLRIDPEF